MYMHIYQLIISEKSYWKEEYASVVDHITPDFVATIPIPRLKPEKEKEIADKVRAAEKKRDEANKTFLAERDEIEKIMFKNINNVNSKD